MSIAPRMKLATPVSIPMEQVRLARDVILAESTALEKLASALPAGIWASGGPCL